MVLGFHQRDAIANARRELADHSRPYQPRRDRSCCNKPNHRHRIDPPVGREVVSLLSLVVSRDVHSLTHFSRARIHDNSQAREIKQFYNALILPPTTAFSQLRHNTTRRKKAIESNKEQQQARKNLAKVEAQAKALAERKKELKAAVAAGSSRKQKAGKAGPAAAPPAISASTTTPAPQPMQEMLPMGVPAGLLLPTAPLSALAYYGDRVENSSSSTTFLPLSEPADRFTHLHFDTDFDGSGV